MSCSLVKCEYLCCTGILNTRLRVRGKRTAFQKNLERLKSEDRRPNNPECASDWLLGRKLGLSSEPSESDEDSEEESASDETPFKGAKPHSDHDSLFDEDSDATVDSSDFIVEDDGAVAAVLPMQFSMETHQDLAHHFKKIFQFFVHIAVHPPADRRKYMEKQMMRRSPLFVKGSYSNQRTHRRRILLSATAGGPEEDLRSQRLTCRILCMETGLHNPPGQLPGT